MAVYISTIDRKPGTSIKPPAGEKLTYDVLFAGITYRFDEYEVLTAKPQRKPAPTHKAFFRLSMLDLDYKVVRCIPGKRPVAYFVERDGDRSFISRIDPVTGVLQHFKMDTRALEHTVREFRDRSRSSKRVENLSVEELGRKKEEACCIFDVGRFVLELEKHITEEEIKSKLNEFEGFDEHDLDLPKVAAAEHGWVVVADEEDSEGFEIAEFGDWVEVGSLTSLASRIGGFVSNYI